MNQKELTVIVHQQFSAMKILGDKSDEIIVDSQYDPQINYHYRSNRYTKEIIDGFYRGLGLTHSRFLIDLEKELGYLFDISVSPFYQSRGFGREMVEAVEGVCKKSKIKKLYIQNSYNDPFWKKMSYVWMPYRKTEILTKKFN